MNKTLGTSAVLAAIACGICGTSRAQSTVTIGGVMDMGARSAKNSGGTIRSVISGGNATSRLTFRGTEDLGDGLRAGFVLEGALAADTGTPSAQFFDRQSIVTLAGPFGELRLGRDWTPVFSGYVFGDPWINTGIGGGGNFLNASVATAYQRAFGSALNPTTLSRSSNAIEYWLPPTLGGLYGNLMISFGERNNAGGAFKYSGGRLGYKNASADVAAYAGATKIDASGASLKQAGVYGAYTFGPATLMASVTNSRYLTSRHTHFMGGVRLTIEQWMLKASYTRMDQKGTGAANESIDANDASQFALGVDYLLSKRTALYLQAARLSNKGAARFAVPGGPATVGAGTSSSGYEAGIRTFF